MGLETGSFIDDLVIANPLGADAKNKGDDHIRLVKKVVKATFPGMAGAAWRVQAKSSAYTVLATDNMTVINCTAALTLSLTAAATLGNQHLFWVIANGGAVTIDPNGAETINGASTLVLIDGETALVVCNSTLFLALVAPMVRTARPAFRATNLLVSNVTGDGTQYNIVFATEIFDQGGDFDGTTDFTAPVTGRYLLTAIIRVSGMTAATVDQLRARIQTSNDNYVSLFDVGDWNGGSFTHTISVVADMDAADTATVVVTHTGDSGGKVHDILAGEAHFSGALLA